ncbi:MAG: hypothetical protein WDW38_000556 [Sanguina aurantia]
MAGCTHAYTPTAWRVRRIWTAVISEDELIQHTKRAHSHLINSEPVKAAARAAAEAASAASSANVAAASAAAALKAQREEATPASTRKPIPSPFPPALAAISSPRPPPHSPTQPPPSGMSHQQQQQAAAAGAPAAAAATGAAAAADAAAATDADAAVWDAGDGAHGAWHDGHAWDDGAWHDGPSWDGVPSRDDGLPALCNPYQQPITQSPNEKRWSANGGSSTRPTPSPVSPSADETTRRVTQFSDLLQETARVAIATGPRGIIRALQAAQSVSNLSVEYISRGVVDPPQVILRRLFESLGSTYIKLGQFIASSPSLFPAEYVTEFQKCLDKADPIPFEVVRKIIDAELGRPWQEVFSSLDSTPLASASVAQVHRAVLKGSNKDVVIKVLKPGVEDVLNTDMAAVYLASRYLEFLQPELSRLSLAGVLEDLRTSVMEEVDFTKEAVNIQQFSTFLDTSGNRASATCPFVYKQYSTKRILVMERLVGVALTDYSAIRGITARDPEAVLIGALNTWFASVLGAETFHADVHAGNLLVLADGRVGFIDFGIVGRVSPVTWKAMEALINAASQSDYDTMARALATIGACDEDVDFPAFAADLQSFFVELEAVNTNVVVSAERGPQGMPNGGTFAASLEVDQTQVNRVLLALVRIGESHGIRFPREFGLFVKQILYFDRYIRLLAPELKVFADDRINVKSLSRHLIHCLCPPLTPSARFLVPALTPFSPPPHGTPPPQDNLLAIASGHTAIILNPSKLDGPRAHVVLPSPDMSAFSVGCKPEHPLSCSAFQTAVMIDMRSRDILNPLSVKALCWSPIGATGRGGCLLAVLSSDRVAPLTFAAMVEHPPDPPTCTREAPVACSSGDTLKQPEPLPNANANGSAALRIFSEPQGSLSGEWVVVADLTTLLKGVMQERDWAPQPSADHLE